jgi:hypothetical protein
MSDGESPPSPVLRASDAERERTATLLRDHAAAGRLTPEELDERLDAAYAARTVGELQALAHDLPATPTVIVPSGRRRLVQPDVRERVVHAVGLVVLVNVACNAIWLAAGADSSWWPKWVLLGTALRLAFQLWALLGPGAGGPARDEARLGRGGVRPRELPRERRDDR